MLRWRKLRDYTMNSCCGRIKYSKWPKQYVQPTCLVKDKVCVEIIITTQLCTRVNAMRIIQAITVIGMRNCWKWWTFSRTISKLTFYRWRYSTTTFLQSLRSSKTSCSSKTDWTKKHSDSSCHFLIIYNPTHSVEWKYSQWSSTLFKKFFIKHRRDLLFDQTNVLNTLSFSVKSQNPSLINL